MRLILNIILPFIACVFFSCGNGEIYLQKAKTLDSLGGALSAMRLNLERTDTALLGRALARFGYYKEFISKNVNDTLLKEEAEHLQQFLSAGQILEDYAKNRKLLMNRSAEAGLQISKLSDDLRNKNVDEKMLVVFAANEKSEIARLMDASATQQIQFHSALQQFKNSLSGVEQMIRKRNHGELPTIIKDTVAL